MPAKKILIAVTNHSALGNTGRETGFWLGEVAHPYLVLIEAGYEIDFVSPLGGAAPMDPGSFDLSDEGNRQFTELQNGKVLENLRNSTLKAELVNQLDYCAIIFAGGHGTMWDFPAAEELQRLALSIYEQGGIIAAVCHGPAVLVNFEDEIGKYLIGGKRVTGFSNAEEAEIQLTDVVPFSLENKLKAAGGLYECADKWQSHVVVCEKVITGQNPQSAHAVGEAVMEALAALDLRS